MRWTWGALALVAGCAPDEGPRLDVPFEAGISEEISWDDDSATGFSAEDLLATVPGEPRAVDFTGSDGVTEALRLSFTPRDLSPAHLLAGDTDFLSVPVRLTLEDDDGNVRLADDDRLIAADLDEVRHGGWIVNPGAPLLRTTGVISGRRGNGWISVVTDPDDPHGSELVGQWSWPREVL